MCGIAGILGPRAGDADSLNRMLDVLRHRGPDDCGAWHGAGVALGQRRLSIIDLEGGRQPISNEDGSCQLVANGEIYNYRELRAELEREGHRFSTHSDSEVILHLWESAGAACLDRLRGMFAFAIWDSKAETLFCARDRLGQKPLFYTQRGDEFVFGSEIKSLLAYDASLSQLDREALDQYLAIRVIAPPRSMFREIRKLPPGHSLTYRRARDGSGGSLEIERYWRLEFEPKLEGSEEELTDQLEERLIACLEKHMVSDVPVGAFLSGGLDSTIIVGMLMRHVAKEPIQTFSVGLPYKEYDEAPYARRVAEQYGTKHREKTVVPSLLETLPRLVWHLDEPSDPLSCCSYLIAEMASEHVKVVLGGDGGDELFGGYDRYYGNIYASRYAAIPGFLRRGVIGPLLGLVPDGSWYKSKSHQLKWLHKLSFLEGSARYAASLSYFYFGHEQRRALYGPEMASLLDTGDPERSIREPFESAAAEELLDRMLWADTQVRLPDHSVMILDRMTMAHGLEARAPFMDHEIAEFCARLPADHKVKGRSLRRIQYRLAERYLPREVLERPKQGFSSAIPYLLRDEYHVLFRFFLEKSQLAEDGLFQQAALDGILKENAEGRTDHGNRLWLLLNSEVWYRMFVRGASEGELSSELRALAKKNEIAV